MGIVQLSDYKIELAGRICLDRFENDVMLLFNKFSQSSVKQITELIKNDVKEIEEKGIVFDVKFLRVFCTMYLGLAWSMYKKGKSIQKEENYIESIIELYNYTNNVNIASECILSNEYIDIIQAMALRYFAIYLGSHLKDMISRMEIGLNPIIENEEQLRTFVLDRLNRFGIRILLIGISDHYKGNNN